MNRSVVLFLSLYLSLFSCKQNRHADTIIYGGTIYTVDSLNSVIEAVAIKDDEVVECGIKENLKIVDLTGAGDLFAGGFLHGHVNNMSLKDSLEKGTEMSSKVIQQIGARL